MLKISLEVSEDNECTSTPWWIIIDPRQNMGLDIHVAAQGVAGPFFSREEAEETLKRTQYNYSREAAVYCKSGYYTKQYKDKCMQAKKDRRERLDKKHWADKPILRHLFWFVVLPYKLGQHLESEGLKDFVEWKYGG